MDTIRYIEMLSYIGVTMHCAACGKSNHSLFLDVLSWFKINFGFGQDTLERAAK
jgi:hypothetical protein